MYKYPLRSIIMSVGLDRKTRLDSLHVLAVANEKNGAGELKATTATTVTAPFNR